MCSYVRVYKARLIFIYIVYIRRVFYLHVFPESIAACLRVDFVYFVNGNGFCMHNYNLQETQSSCL